MLFQAALAQRERIQKGSSFMVFRHLLLPDVAIKNSMHSCASVTTWIGTECESSSSCYELPTSASVIEAPMISCLIGSLEHVVISSPILPWWCSHHWSPPSLPGWSGRKRYSPCVPLAETKMSRGHTMRLQFHCNLSPKRGKLHHDSNVASLLIPTKNILCPDLLIQCIYKLYYIIIRFSFLQYHRNCALLCIVCKYLWVICIDVNQLAMQLRHAMTCYQ